MVEAETSKDRLKVGSRSRFGKGVVGGELARVRGMCRAKWIGHGRDGRDALRPMLGVSFGVSRRAPNRVKRCKSRSRYSRRHFASQVMSPCLWIYLNVGWAKVLVHFPDAFLNSPQFCAVQFSFE